MLPALASQMVNLIEFEQLDLLHVTLYLASCYDYLARQIMAERGLNVPIVTTLHGTDITLVGKDPSYKHVVGLPLIKVMGDRGFQSICGVRHVNFEIKQEIKVIPNFIDLERFKASDGTRIEKGISPKWRKDNCSRV